MSADSEETIRLTRDGGVATIWLDRPSKRNAMTHDMWTRLGELATQLGADSGIRVVILRGTGPHFCAGADITELTVARPAEASFSDAVMTAENALATLPKPTVAFITGDCIGGGCSLAIDCDIRIATPGARFGITPSKLGIVYPSHALERATHLLGPSATKRLLFTGDLITTEEARRIGLVDDVVDPARADGHLATLTGVLAARSLLTQAAVKAMVAEIAAHGEVPASVRDHWDRIAAGSPDAAEGVAAFVDKRAARFTWSGHHDE
ncbi:MAG TPA: enoyl-CoA hydratase/isomerase family protein [Ilumatobacteraceae bacterium]|jgi:enoyl-CoA hydratase/carnithine racemase